MRGVDDFGLGVQLKLMATATAPTRMTLAMHCRTLPTPGTTTPGTSWTGC
ncbi:hypothetical protein ACFCWV_24690 [Streptomyces sp. NPDC056341]